MSQRPAPVQLSACGTGGWRSASACRLGEWPGASRTVPGDPRRPAARRRPVRLRTVQGARRPAAPLRRAGRPGAGHLAPPAAGEVAGRPDPGRAEPSCSGCRPATRWCSATAARPRSGTPPPSAWSAQRSQHVSVGEFSAKFAAVTRGAPFLAEPSVRAAEPGTAIYAGVRGRHRRLRLAAERDLDRGDARRPAGARRRPTRCTWWTPPRRRPACRWTSASPTSTTSPRRRASPARAGCGWPSSPPPPLDRVAELRGLRTLDAAVAGPGHRAGQQRQGPDLQHPGDRHPVAAGPPDRGPAAPRRAGRQHRPQRRVRRPAVLAGPRPSPFARPFVADPAVRSSVVGTIDFVRRGAGRPAGHGAARQRHRRHRAVPRAGPQPAADRDVPGGRSRRRRGADRLHRLAGARG